MNSSEKENQAKSDRKTRAQLQKLLSEAHDVLEEQEKELVTLRKELEKTKAKITELKEQQMEPASKQDELSQARAELNDMTQQMEQLKQEVEKLKRIHEKDQEEKEVLKNRLQTAKEDDESEREEELAQTKVQAEGLKGKISDLEKKNKRLKEQIENLQKTEEAFPEDSGTGKAAFRIDLYPHEGHYQGKVRLLGTKKKKAFSGLDGKAISDFMNEHLPQPEAPVVAPEPVTSVPATPPVETQKPAFKTVSIRKFTLMREERMQKEKLIPHDQIFQVALTVDPLESIVAENLPCPFKISVYAKRMGGGLRKTLGKTSGQITSAGEFTANVHCAPLPAGIYRFVAFGTINIKKDRQGSIAQFQESSIFNVA